MLLLLLPPCPDSRRGGEGVVVAAAAMPRLENRGRKSGEVVVLLLLLLSPPCPDLRRGERCCCCRWAWTREKRESVAAAVPGLEKRGRREREFV